MRIAIIAASTLAFSAPLAAQVCELGWQPGFGWDPPSEASHAIVTAAPLGREIVFVGGEFTSSVLGKPLSRVASFDGERWDDLAGGVDGTVRAMVAWDPDGPGPQRELVVVAGDFTQAGLSDPGGPVEAARVAVWDGVAWAPVGAGLAGEAGTLAVCDIDGDGVGELFATSLEDGVESVVWQFDGGAWRAIGRWPASEPIRSMATYAGPALPRLVAATGTTVRAWDGASWETLPATTGPVGSLAMFPRDGTTTPALFAITLWFRSSSFEKLVGGAWQREYGIDYGQARALAPLDSDGAGPEPEGLYFNTYRTVTFNGLYSMLTRYPGLLERPYTVTFPSLNPDIIRDMIGWQREPGRPPEFWLARQTPDFPWQPGSVTALSNEPDRLGLGLGPFVSFYRGVVSLAGVPDHRLIGWSPRSLARYDGEAWRLWVTADNTISDALAVDERRLYLGGSFRELSGRPMRGVAVYEDGAWRQVGAGLESVEALAFADLGRGSRLYAVGRRATVAGTPGVSEWDGERWTTVGASDFHPLSVTAHDPDGAGPLPAELIVGGVFRTIGGVEAAGLAAFDGASWRSLDWAFDTARDIVSHDDDGRGPRLAMLHVKDRAGVVRRFAEGAWERVGGPDDNFEQILSFDPDGDGPQPPMLLATTDDSSGGTTRLRLARLEEDVWVEHASDILGWCPDAWSCVSPSIRAVTLTREGAAVPALAFTGPFLAVDGEPSAGIALWIGACPCAADCDGDGDLTFLDFLCFQNRFAAGDPAADCDGDGGLTFFDFLCFQAAFAAGCD